MSGNALIVLWVARDDGASDALPKEALITLTPSYVAELRKMRDILRAAKLADPRALTLRFNPSALDNVNVVFVDPIETDSIVDQVNGDDDPEATEYDLQEDGPLLLEDAEDLEYEEFDIGELSVSVHEDGVEWQAFGPGASLLMTDELSFDALDHLFPVK